MDELIAKTEKERSRFRSEKQYLDLLETYRKAREVYASLAR